MIIVSKVIPIDNLPNLEEKMFFNEDEMVKAVAREKIKELVEKWIKI